MTSLAKLLSSVPVSLISITFKRQSCGSRTIAREVWGPRSRAHVVHAHASPRKVSTKFEALLVPFGETQEGFCHPECSSSITPRDKEFSGSDDEEMGSTGARDLQDKSWPRWTWSSSILVTMVDD